MQARRKVRIGRVISDKMDKTVVVSSESLRRHPLYKKVVRHTSKFKAHDETNACKIGDVVRIIETRPLSKDKRWRVVEIIRRKEAAEVEPTDAI
ncbi:MAG TPA: 30S ribosomal protein S17 [Dehalococcoidia bacterium]|nr:30S ribosomal protein S17 [Dehalococcoidia bacterium]